MQIKQNSISTDLKKEIISRVSTMLSIEKARLVEKTTDCVQSQDSASSLAPNTTNFNLFILPDPTNENLDNTPVKLARNLNGRTDEIREFVPRLASGDLTGIKELVAEQDVPTFTVRPKYSKSDYEFITISVFFYLNLPYLI